MSEPKVHYVVEYREIRPISAPEPCIHAQVAGACDHDPPCIGCLGMKIFWRVSSFPKSAYVTETAARAALTPLKAKNQVCRIVKVTSLREEIVDHGERI